ncbi:lysophospholipase L1-like esterase [Nakamurella sp. UYEF19]|uniref:GDSL-type esterase/lipase family protein n=1 Tax=Nakamurella sp. UYEF19 TaxID=1756392 RepID=UPI003392055E
MRIRNHRHRRRISVVTGALLVAIAIAIAACTTQSSTSGSATSSPAESSSGDSSQGDSSQGNSASTDPAPTAASSGTSPGTSGTPTRSATVGPDDKYYVSIGDSYAAGYQPSGPDDGGTTSNGFAYQLATRSRSTSTPLQLVNFACSGVTSTALVTTKGCEAGALGPGAPSYAGRTQAAAAIEFLSTQRSRIGLVTVVIGGNDVKDCVTAASPQKCIEGAIPVLRRNLEPLLAAIRTAVGSAVPIVGLTYPDVFLGDALKGTSASITLAERSLLLFKDYLNPALNLLYAAHGATFLDITAATGAYGDVTQRVEVAPYGSIPRPIAQICTLTFYCQYGDIHPRTVGYQLIAESISHVVFK